MNTYVIINACEYNDIISFKILYLIKTYLYTIYVYIIMAGSRKLCVQSKLLQIIYIIIINPEWSYARQ